MTTALENHNFAWTAEADTALRAMWSAGHSLSDIKAQLGCWKIKVRRRARALNLPARAVSITVPRAPVDGAIRQMLEDGLSHQVVAYRLGRSSGTFQRVAEKLGLWPMDRSERIRRIAAAVVAGRISPGDTVIRAFTAADLATFRPLVAEERPRSVSLARPGQASFRMAVLKNYSGRCAITRTAISCAIEAAHIVPFALAGDHRLSNGLALRSDIHALFDEGLVSIDPETMTIVTAQSLGGDEYHLLRGRPLHLDGVQVKPSPQSLRWHLDKKFTP